MALKNFWEVVKVRANRPNRNFGTVIAETADNALIRFLHTKGAEAMIGIRGDIVYTNPRNEDIWGRRDTWEVRPCKKSKRQTCRTSVDRDKESLEHARARAMETWL